MAEEELSNIEKAEEAYQKMCGFRTDAEFREDEGEMSLKLQQATLAALEAIYHQNEELLNRLPSD
ncbi:MAG: hypothetical protein V5A84_03120 [Planctomycetota bacterium]